MQKKLIIAAFKNEMDGVRRAHAGGDTDRVFQLLERAHIIGQRYFGMHMLTHFWMLRIGIHRRDVREIIGQIMRMTAVVPGYAFGWVPKGNTGGADVSPIRPMPIPTDMKDLLQSYNVWKDVLGRMLILGLIFLLVSGFLFARGVWLRSGENRTIISSFDGTCTPLTGFNGPEDIVLDAERRIAYIVGGDRRSFRSGGPGRAAIWAIPFDAPETAAPVDISPETPEVFRSFGLDLHINDLGERRLFVANRPSDGHTIEIFLINDNGALKHERTLKTPLLKNPNDLVAIGQDGALVTLDKEADAATLAEIFEGARQQRTGKVIRIDSQGAEILAEGLLMANGIGLSANGETLYVGETVGQRLSVFDRDPQTNTLVFGHYVQIDTGVDNLTVNQDGRVYIAGHPKLLTLALKYQKSEATPSPSEVVVYDPQMQSVDRLYVNDGTEIAGSEVPLVS